MKIKAVVFKTQLRQIVPGREEDEPRRWFRDRMILLLHIQPSLPVEILTMDELFTESHEILRFAETQGFVPTSVLVVSDNEAFLRWAVEQKFHTATLYNIDDIVGCILLIEYEKEI